MAVQSSISCNTNFFFFFFFNNFLFNWIVRLLENIFGQQLSMRLLDSCAICPDALINQNLRYYQKRCMFKELSNGVNSFKIGGRNYSVYSQVISGSRGLK